MKLFFLSLAVGAVVGWIIFGMRVQFSDEGTNSPRLSPDGIRLLGGNGNVDVPWSSSGEPFESVHEILTKIDSASPAKLRIWLKSLIESPNASEVALNAIIARLAVLDPAGTFALLKGKDTFEHHLSTVLVTWAQEDLSAAIDAVITRDNRSILLKNLISGLDATTCEKLYDDLLERGYHLADAPILWHLFGQLAGHDLEGTLSKAVDASLEADSDDRSIDHAITHWYREDPEAALKWAIDQENPKAAKLAMDALVRVAILNDGAEGAALVWEHLDEAQHKAILNRYIKLSTDDMDGWLDWIDAHVASPKQHREMMEGVLYALGQSGDPGKMPAILETTKDSVTPMPAYIIEHVTHRWAETDLEGLQEWMGKIDVPHVREAAEKALVYHWSDSDPMKVIEFWEKSNGEEYSKSPDSASHIIRKLFNQLDVFSSDGDPQDLIKLLPESLRDEAMIPFISGMVKESPGEAIRLLESQPEGKGHNQVMQTAVAHWVSEDPLGASEWVTAMEDGDSKNQASQNLANTWARYDLQAAQAWIADQPVSESRDWAVRAYVSLAADYAPEDTLSLALTVTDQEMRDQLVKDSINGIVRDDPDRASEMIQTTNLPDTLRDELSQLIDRERTFQASFE